MVEWRQWSAGPCPVPSAARVECLSMDRRRAFGLAVAFNWNDPRKPALVGWWRFYLPGNELETDGIVEPRPPRLP